METHCRVIALLSKSASLSVQLKARLVQCICEALEHDTFRLKYVV